MTNIDDKLTYLSETKNIFKNSLNSLGAEITSSTTFRNYLNWLDAFYDNVSNKTDLATNGIEGRTGQNTGPLPTEYTQIDYIESSRSQYIDTGVNADNRLRVVLDMAYSDLVTASNGSMIGAINRTSSSSYTRYHLSLTSSTFVFYASGTSYNISSSNTNRHIFDLNVPNLTFKIDDTSVTLRNVTFDTQLNFWLFGRNSNTDNLKAYSAQKLYSCKMYYDDELIRDFIPCYRNSDNEIGLYDLIDNAFYSNQGTGTFTYNSTITIPNPDEPQPINNLTGNISYKIITQNDEQTFTIPLGNIALNNIDGNVDNIHSENGKFYLYKETGIHILNGSESWGFNSSPSTPTPRSVAFTTHTDSDYSKRYYSNRFVYGDTSTSNRLVLGNSGAPERWYLSLDNTLTNITSSDTNAQKLEKIKTYISNNNIEVDYVLKTPTTTEITSSNYPALYAVLKEIQDYLTQYKINKEFLLDYSSPEIEY